MLTILIATNKQTKSAVICNENENIFFLEQGQT